MFLSCILFYVKQIVFIQRLLKFYKITRHQLAIALTSSYSSFELFSLIFIQAAHLILYDVIIIHTISVQSDASQISTKTKLPITIYYLKKQLLSFQTTKKIQNISINKSQNNQGLISINRINIQMTEQKITDKQQPSIHNIEIKHDYNASLSDFDVIKLFKGPKFSKFEMTDIKLQTFFCKREAAQFFIRKLDSWNDRIHEQQNIPNIRTQFILLEFIYFSLKRISLMKQSEIDRQLELLNNWFLDKSKNSFVFNKASMPQNKHQNQYYNVTKSFKTNPALLIDEYRRPMYFLCNQNKKFESFQKVNAKPLKNNLQGNFLTQLQENKNKNANTKFKDSQDKMKCFFVTKLQKQIREEQMRRYLEKKEIEQQQWAFKLKKQRLIAQGAKNYLGGKYQQSFRQIKSSQGARQRQRQGKSSQVIEQMKKMRVYTSSSKRSLKKASSLNKPISTSNFQIAQIGNLNLLTNPFQVKIKTKNKKNLKIKSNSKNKV